MGIFANIFNNIIGNYDLETLEGINSIPVPAKDGLEYDLQRKATEHKRNGRMDLAIACLYKSNQLMPHASMTYKKSDYLRLVSYLEKAGRFDEADKEEKRIEKMFKNVPNPNKERMKGLSSNGYDLVQFTEHHPTCAECALYQGRVFSISGKDKRFPKLPDHIRKSGKVHDGCIHTIVPYITEFLSASELNHDIRFSNRPFVDDRTKEERELYEKQQYENMVADYDLNNYNQLIRLLPNSAPKSYGAYRRMKNSNSTNYQKLVAEAAAIGLNIDEYRINAVSAEPPAVSDQQRDISKASILSIVNDCERIIDSTKNIETFFSRYDTLIEHLNILIYRYGHLRDRINEDTALFPEKLQACIGRIVDDLTNLKTARGMLNRLDSTLECLINRQGIETNQQWYEAEQQNCSTLWDLKKQIENIKKS